MIISIRLEFLKLFNCVQIICEIEMLDITLYKKS